VTGPTVIVAGAMANKPHNGGEAWVRLSWIRGLQRLGCDVWFVEQIGAAHCTDSEGRAATFASSANRSWFIDMMARFGLTDRSSLLCDSGEYVGVSPDQVLSVAQRTDLLVNISGHLYDSDVLAACARRAYIDIDPGFTQYWDAGGNRGARLDGHDHYFTIGANIGHESCEIPTGEFAWQHIRPPVVLADWPVVRSKVGAFDSAGRPRFTTIATWRGPFGPIELSRRRFGLKVHEFRKFLGIASLVDASFEAALAIHPDETPDLQRLRDEAWVVRDPRACAGGADEFRSFVASSAAEFSVAQGIYVETNSGWFSDRTTRYLASGRPVLVQDTGFSRTLPIGKGLIAFSTMDEAIDGAATIIDNYDLHAAAARGVAEEFFDSDVVLPAFLNVCLNDVCLNDVRLTDVRP
jgi:hypothetical protein